MRCMSYNTMANEGTRICGDILVGARYTGFLDLTMIQIMKLPSPGSLHVLSGLVATMFRQISARTSLNSTPSQVLDVNAWEVHLRPKFSRLIASVGRGRKHKCLQWGHVL